MLVHMTSTEVL